MDNATLAEVFVPFRPDAHSTVQPNGHSISSSSGANATSPLDVDAPFMEQDIVEMLVPTLLETEKELRQEEQLMKRVLPSVVPAAFGSSGLTEALTRVYAVSVAVQSVWLSERLRIKTVRAACLAHSIFSGVYCYY